MQVTFIIHSLRRQIHYFIKFRSSYLTPTKSYLSFLLFSVTINHCWNEQESTKNILNQPPAQNRNNNNKWKFSCKHLIYFNFYLPSFSFLIIFITITMLISHNLHYRQLLCKFISLYYDFLQSNMQEEWLKKEGGKKREVKQERLPNTHACKCKRVSTQCLLHSRQAKFPFKKIYWPEFQMNLHSLKL